jgi:hypothetical protein
MDPATLLFISQNVVQIQVEIHFKGQVETEALARAFTDAGFRAFSKLFVRLCFSIVSYSYLTGKEPNIKFSDGSCIEYSLLNTKLIL